MKNRGSLFIGFAFMCITVLSFGQRNFVPGSIVRLEGDTVKGFIDYRNWQANPKYVGFKKTADGERTEFHALAIKSFVANQEVYEGAIIAVEESLPTVNELKYRVDTVFLQATFLGSKSLYQYEDYYGKEQFYIKQDEKFTLLLYKEYQDMLGGSGTVKQNKRYLGQLTFYLSACKSLQSELNNTAYSKKDLHALFAAYYECTGEQVRFKKTRDKAITEWGLIGGYTATRLGFISFYDYPYQALNESLPLSKSLSGGILLDIISPRSNKKWSSYNELFFTSYRAKDARSDYGDDQYLIITARHQYSYVKLNNMVRYSFPVGDFRIFINAGIANGFMISGKSRLTYESRFYSTITSSERDDLVYVRKFERSVLAGLGLKYLKFSLEYRHEKPYGVSGKSLFAGGTSSNFILAAYRF